MTLAISMHDLQLTDHWPFDHASLTYPFYSSRFIFITSKMTSNNNVPLHHQFYTIFAYNVQSYFHLHVTCYFSDSLLPRKMATSNHVPLSHHFYSRFANSMQSGSRQPCLFYLPLTFKNRFFRARWQPITMSLLLTNSILDLPILCNRKVGNHVSLIYLLRFASSVQDGRQW